MTEQKETLNETVGRMLDLAVAGRWGILTSIFVIALLGISVAMSLPDQYTSNALLVLVQPQISQRYVDPLSTMSNMETVATIRREVLSTSRLLGIIHSVSLYDEKVRRRLRPEHLAARLREEVMIDFVGPQGPGRDPNAFTVSFTARTPQLAQAVTSRVASAFIEANSETRENQVETTTRFFAEQIAAAKQKLAQQEQRLRDFKTRNVGELPEQEHANVGALTDLRIQLQNTMSNLNRARQQQRSSELVLSGTMTRLQSERKGLLRRLTPLHPEVVKKDQEIQILENLLARLKDGKVIIQGRQLAPDHDPAIVKLMEQAEEGLVEIENLSKEERRLRSEIAQYENRLRVAPVRQQELSVLLRDYELFKQEYTDLLNNQLRAELTKSVEEQGAAQQFRVVEPPTLPIGPSGPNRRMIGLGAAGAGLALGLALAFLRRMWDRSFHAEKEVRQHFSLPLIIAVPSLYTPREERGRRRKRVLEWVAASAMLLIVAAAELFVYRHG